MIHAAGEVLTKENFIPQRWDPLKAPCYCVADSPYSNQERQAIRVHYESNTGQQHRRNGTKPYNYGWAGIPKEERRIYASDGQKRTFPS